MENSINLERDKKFGMSKYLGKNDFENRMDELEDEAKKKIEKILDKNIKDTTENVLKQTDANTTLGMMKKSSGTVDSFKDKIKSFLLSLLEKTN